MTPPNSSPEQATLDIDAIRAQFPILTRQINGHPLVYLDNAATTQKPRCVIDAISHFYEHTNANVHRGVHTLSQEATIAYEQVRDKIARRLNAAESREIIFTRGTTESINLVASSWGRANLKPGDEILLTHLEHHSNIVPWQLIAEQTGAVIKVIPINDEGELIDSEIANLITERTAIVAIVHVSNAIGTINPIRKVCDLAHQAGAVVLVDGAQGIQHQPVDVRALGCDFYTFSGHKMFGPTGVGGFYGRAELLEAMPPYQGGGDMIRSVTFEKSTYNILPNKFEAGTPNIAGVVGLGAAIDFLDSLDFDAVQRWEHMLLDRVISVVGEMPGIRLIGTARDRTASLSFVLEDIHPHDIGTVLDDQGIAIRTGHHCTQPLMERFRVPATARASFCLYNTPDEVDALARGLLKVIEVFS